MTLASSSFFLLVKKNYFYFKLLQHFNFSILDVHNFQTTQVVTSQATLTNVLWTRPIFNSRIYSTLSSSLPPSSSLPRPHTHKHKPLQEYYIKSKIEKMKRLQKARSSSNSSRIIILPGIYIYILNIIFSSSEHNNNTFG